MLAVNYRKRVHISTFSNMYVKQKVDSPGSSRKKWDIGKRKGLHDTEKPGQLARLHLSFFITFSMSA